MYLSVGAWLIPLESIKSKGGILVTNPIDYKITNVFSVWKLKKLPWDFEKKKQKHIYLKELYQR